MHCAIAALFFVIPERDAVLNVRRLCAGSLLLGGDMLMATAGTAMPTFAVATAGASWSP